ncbi:MAG: hypothetical protein DRJ45_00705 [Thermoprotei archaeon]|nr:MAG: hypothetical protein DRJ45_00705 [Thermoprotei archaeon]
MPRVVIVGLDGVPWSVINRLYEDGVVDVLPEIAKEGAHGTLTSIIPPYTVPAWTSMATGVNPGKHGAYSTHVPQPDYSLRLLTSGDVLYPRVYECLSMCGMESVVVNLPLSYPPRLFRGVMVSDWLYPKLKVYPEEESAFLRGYSQPDPLWALYSPAGYSRTLLEGLNGRIGAIKRLFQNVNWDMFFVVFSETDFLLHKDYENIINGGNSHPSRNVFHKIDSFVGWILDRLPQDCLLLVVSDHGFAKYRCVVHVNSLLRNLGLITLKAFRRGTTDFSGRLPIPRFAYRYIYRSRNLRRLVGPVLDYLGFNSASLYLRIPASKSYAFMLPDHFGIYINSRDIFSNWLLKKREAVSIKRKLIRLLRRIKNPKNGNHLFSAVYAREDVFSGPNVHRIPHIILVPSAPCWMDHEIAGAPVEVRTHIDHSLTGMVVLYGCDVKAGTKLKGASLLDITPTILHYLGLSVDSRADGRPLLEAFKPSSAVRQRPVRFGDYLSRWRAALKFKLLREKIKHRGKHA